MAPQQSFLRAVVVAVVCALSLSSSAAAAVAEQDTTLEANERLRVLQSLADQEEALMDMGTDAPLEMHNHDNPEGWPEVGPESFQTVEKMLKEYKATKGDRAQFPRIIQPLSFINFVKTDGTGRNSYEAMQKQVDQLNLAYSGAEARDANYAGATDTNIRFKLAGIRYVVNDNYYDLCSLPSTISVIRPRYMMSGAIHLNVYVCWCENNLGLSWLPYDAWFRQNTDENHFALGAIVHSNLLPGNNMRNGLWAQGDILTHEIGHSYGLRHPYEGDCYGTEANSDQIDDTPRMTGNPLATCAAVKNRDSCPGGGKDDMQNYMVATADTCRSHFTPGQVEFMQMTIIVYKPTLVKQLLPSCVAAIDSSDYSPDLQPCLAGTLKTLADGRRWCKTDPDNVDVWGWACCPESMDWTEQACWQGSPVFSLPSKQVDIPKAGSVGGTFPPASPTPPPTLPTKAPTALTKAPTLAPTKKPTSAPTKKPTSTPTVKLTSPPTDVAAKLTHAPTKRPTKKPTTKKKKKAQKKKKNQKKARGLESELNIEEQ